MVVLGVVIAVLCFLYLSLRTLLRAARERRVEQRSICRNLPRISHEVIQTLCAEFTKIQDQGKLTQAGRDYAAELRLEQPALFALLIEILQQSDIDNPGELTSGLIVYKLLKAQIEADLLDQSFDPPAKSH